MSETTEPKVMHEWTLAGYHSRIVETQPGIVTSEQAMDDDKLGRLWLPKVAPMGWQNEMIQLAAEVARLSALVPRWVDPKQREPERYVAVQSVVEREGTGERKVQCLWLGDDADDFNPHRVMWMESADDPLEGWKVIAWLEVPIPPLPGTETD